MSVFDLHPEELLDKHELGALTDSERTRLFLHVASCAVCRFELRTRADFAQLSHDLPKAPGVGPRASHPEGTLEAATSKPSLRAISREGTSTRKRKRRRVAVVLGAMAALIAGVSFAALSTGLVGKRGLLADPTLSQARPPAAKSVAAVDRATAVPSPQPAPTEASLPSPPAAIPVAPRSDDAKTPRDPSRPRGASASELFHAANAARRDHDSERAIAMYRALEAEFPHSEEARVSYATLGSLLLDRGDPSAALAGFDRYLSRGGSALGEEALVGRALAFQKLGTHDGEVAAWREVLGRFPESVHARLARSRLAALGER